MELVVCIKQVPAITEVKIDPKTGTLIREGVPCEVNPDDKHAVEEAIKLRERYGGKVTVISMGPPQADEALREILAMGVDEAILLTDKAFAGADTLATAFTLGSAIKALKPGYGLVFCGREATDGDTAQTGPQLAECLGVPQITYVKRIEVNAKTRKIVADRSLEDGYERIEAPMPALVTVVRDLNKPRYPSVGGIVDAYRERKVRLVKPRDVGLSEENIGLSGSPTQVKRTFTPEHHRAGEILEGDTKKMVSQLVERLKDRNVLKPKVT
jgi:electron transfer flavoprotein beta subunit